MSFQIEKGKNDIEPFFILRTRIILITPPAAGRGYGSGRVFPPARGALPRALRSAHGAEQRFEKFSEQLFGLVRDRSGAIGQFGWSFFTPF